MERIKKAGEQLMNCLDSLLASCKVLEGTTISEEIYRIVDVIVHHLDMPIEELVSEIEVTLFNKTFSESEKLRNRLLIHELRETKAAEMRELKALYLNLLRVNDEVVAEIESSF